MNILSPPKRPLRISLFLLAFLFIYASVSLVQQNSPVEVVNLFVEGYAGPQVDEIVQHTAAHFRDNKPKSVWVVDTWKPLHRLKYQKLNNSIINSKVSGDKAIVVTEARIKTAAGEVAQREVYYLVREGERWLINDLRVTDEEIDLNKIHL